MKTCWTNASRLNVFHECPHSQNYLSSFRCVQPQSGQRMRGVPGFFSSSRSQSGTMTGLSATGIMLAIMTYAPLWPIVSSFSFYPWYPMISRVRAAHRSIRIMYSESKRAYRHCGRAESLTECGHPYSET